MKRRLIFICTTLLIFTSTSVTNISAATDTTNHRDEKRAVKFFNKIKNFNYKLNQQLAQKTKSAINKFKANSQSVEEKSDNLKIYWSTFINKINYLKNDQLEIYVTKEFKSLTHKKRAQIVDSVQRLALSHLEDFKAVTPYRSKTGLAASIFCDGDYLGRSLFLDNSNFKWND
ncbi:hypothetical protein [Companilactobacillus sp. HBUAS56275]|jgi:hypothetical protein|uniref:Uncharacterized protein n=1 Tax=Candidatus Companilactobacillus pullicola TaxID=2838523 RepID=A0A9D1ZMY7_9LACO|nr:hypothetical protein [Candidatus Companilactobacillus pullicola]